ncbi:MAG TPA: DUF4124 domain-containing protein, partial [Rhizobacter sp.]|nr:DUF4124 domain-containing protein [Rhizobacter sp.]
KVPLSRGLRAPTIAQIVNHELTFERVSTPAAPYDPRNPSRVIQMSFSSARLPQAVLVLILAASSAVASAEIHRCKDDSGQTVLSDRPCGADNAAQDAHKRSVGVVADRIAAPEMVSARTRELASQYEFISERGGRASGRSVESQGAK